MHILEMGVVMDACLVYRCHVLCDIPSRAKGVPEYALYSALAVNFYRYFNDLSVHFPPLQLLAKEMLWTGNLTSI